MYTGLLHAHSWLRWIMLLLLLITVFKAYSGWKGNRTFTKGDRNLVLYTVITAHLQLLIGLILYMMSPLVQSALSNMGGAMKDATLRFYAVEHILMMVIAIVIITIGNAVAKRAETDALKFKRVFIYFLISLVLIIMRIPWPFMEAGEGRGWF